MENFSHGVENRPAAAERRGAKGRFRISLIRICVYSYKSIQRIRLGASRRIRGPIAHRPAPAENRTAPPPGGLLRENPSKCRPPSGRMPPKNPMRTERLIRWTLIGLLAATRLAAAAVRLEIEGVSGELRDNVRLFVGEPPGDDPLVVRRHAEGAADRARAALEALGHYEASVRVAARREGDVRILRIDVEPGGPVRLDAVEMVVEGEAIGDPAFADLLARLPLKPGDVLHHGRYEEAKRSIENLARARGYFDGRFAESTLRIRRGDRQADVVLRCDSGNRFRFGPVRLSPTPLSEKLLRRLVPFQEGDPYSAERVSALHLNLLRSGYFDEIRILPRPEEAGENETVPVDAKLVAASRNRVSLGVGAATDVGPRLRLEWTRPWMNRRGHSAVLKNELSLVRQDLSAQYSIPLNPPLAHQLQFTGGWQREDIEDTDRETWSAGIQRRRLYDSGWQQNLFLRWEQERFTQADVHDTTTLTLPGLSLGRTRRTGGIHPIRGDRLSGLFETAHPDFFSDIRLARVLLQAKRLDSRGPHRLLGRIEYGALNTEDFDRTPPSLRFFAGGDQSVRGFGYQTLSPRNAEGEFVGGRYLLTGSLEYNYEFLRRWRIAAFFDAGNASADSRFSDGFAQGAGFGVRWLSPLAPLKLDFAWGVSESDPPFRVHFSMGSEL
ncbi:MAG: outer membrane protein assembly factor [Opitutae bacterium]|nr:outer membrane protein assembly factor [Opitutae bacterium]